MSTPWYLDPIGQGYSPTGHTGLDFETPIGTPLSALLPGTITDASHQPWGWQVVERIDLPGFGWVNEVVAHLDSVAVHTGQVVAAGDVLGLSGGENLPAQYSNGPHTHLGLYTGPVWQNATSTGAIETVDPHRLLDLVTGGGGAAAPTSTLATTTTLGLPDLFGVELGKINAGITDWLKRGALIFAGAVLIILAVIVLMLDHNGGGGGDKLASAAKIAAVA